MTTNDEEDYEVLPESQETYDFSFKIIVIGDSFVGKSSLALRASKNVFENNYNATVGFEFFSLSIKYFGAIIEHLSVSS